jgi:predicted transposase YbfD/YdcC
VSIEPDAAAYPHAAQLVSLHRQRTHKATGENKTGTRYFALSLRGNETTPERVAKQIRGYWAVENKVHWRRDVIGGEDQCRLREANSACALALLRTALLALVVASGRRSLKEAQEELAYKPYRALHLIRFQRLAKRE